MEEVKEINVTLTPHDQKSFSRTGKGGTRKRKEPKDSSSGEVPIQKTDVPIAEPNHVESVPVPVPVPVSVATPEPTKTSVLIQPKKVPEKSLGPRINPMKKRMVPMKTLKKPSLSIPAIPGTIESDLGEKKTRKYTARRISIEMQPIAITRNNRRILKHRIAKMSLEVVKKTLLEKGILKQKHASSLSDELLRSMLKDYMSLHAMD